MKKNKSKLIFSLILSIFILSGCAISFTNKIPTHPITAIDFEFSPKEITVNAGEPFIIDFQNKAGRHNLVIENTKFRTSVLSDNNNEQITVQIDKPGKYTYFSSVGSHRQLGMTGVIIVK